MPGSPLTGDEVVPAFPDVYPDPPVSRADLPAGVQGDVIVEVTIDSGGNVVDMKLVKGIGYGVEQKVLEVLQRWHFHPATRDGMTIASQHIVHFHYPSLAVAHSAFAADVHCRVTSITPPCDVHTRPLLPCRYT